MCLKELKRLAHNKKRRDARKTDKELKEEEERLKKMQEEFIKRWKQ